MGFNSGFKGLILPAERMPTCNAMFSSFARVTEMSALKYYRAVRVKRRMETTK